MKLLRIILINLVTVSIANATEANHRDAWIKQHGGKKEVRLADGTQADIITKTHAIEVEWAHKWYEGFGQALWYAFQTGKKPGIVLILRTPKDEKFLLRLRSLAAHHKIEIQIWTMNEIKQPIIEK